MMAGAMDPNADMYKGLTPEQIQAKLNHKLDVSKALRTTGQAIFLALTVIFGVFVLHTLRRGQRHGGITKTIILFIIVAIMLHVRGIFGVLQAAVYSVSHCHPSLAHTPSFHTTTRKTLPPMASRTVSRRSSTVSLFSPSFQRKLTPTAPRLPRSHPSALALNISWRTSAIEAPIKQHGIQDPEDGHVLSAKRTDDESRACEDEPKP